MAKNRPGSLRLNLRGASFGGGKIDLKAQLAHQLLDRAERNQNPIARNLEPSVDRTIMPVDDQRGAADQSLDVATADRDANHAERTVPLTPGLGVRAAQKSDERRQVQVVAFGFAQDFDKKGPLFAVAPFVRGTVWRARPRIGVSRRIGIGREDGIEVDVSTRYGRVRIALIL